VNDLRDFLLGSWVLRRALVDDRAQRHYRFEGSALFAPLEDGALDYRERGVLRGDGHEGIATRRLIYCFAEPSRAIVHFPDGHLFHALDLSRSRTSVRHDCPPDRYDGTFVIDGRDLLVRWRVRGPETSYVSTPRYVRPGEDDAGAV